MEKPWLFSIGCIIVLVCLFTFFSVDLYTRWQREIAFTELLEDKGLEIKEIHLDSIYVLVDEAEFLELTEKTNVVYHRRASFFVYIDGLWYCHWV